MKAKKRTFSFSDCHVEIEGGNLFENCCAEVIYQRQHSRHSYEERFCGFIEFPFPKPKIDAFGKNNIPKCLKVVIEDTNKKAELTDLLFTEGKIVSRTDWVSRDGKIHTT